MRNSSPNLSGIVSVLLSGSSTNSRILPISDLCLIGDLVIFWFSKISNAPDGEFNTYARVRPFIASGSLFSHGVKVEKATVDYNSASIVEFAPGGDYGSITNSAGTTTDYGTVTSQVTPDGEVDLGQIIITETRQPLTGLFKFAGAAPSSVRSWTLCC